MYGITPKELRDANPDFEFNRKTWRAGTVLNLPLTADVQESVELIPERSLR